MILSRLDRVILVGTWEILQAKAHKTRKYHRTGLHAIRAVVRRPVLRIVFAAASADFTCVPWSINVAFLDISYGDIITAVRLALCFCMVAR